MKASEAAMAPEQAGRRIRQYHAHGADAVHAHSSYASNDHAASPEMKS